MRTQLEYQNNKDGTIWERLYKVSFVTWLLTFGFQFSANALPGSTLEQSVQHIQSNDIGRRASFDRDTLVVYTFYTATLVHEGINLSISVASPAASFFQDNTDSLSVSNSPIGAQLAEDNYNIRQDDRFVELVEGIWGGTVAQDFENSQFTDRYRYEYGANEFIHRNLYRGQRFGYSVSYDDRESSLYIRIYSLQDWAYMRIPSEFEERI